MMYFFCTIHRWSATSNTSKAKASTSSDPHLGTSATIGKSNTRQPKQTPQQDPLRPDTNWDGVVKNDFLKRYTCTTDTATKTANECSLQIEAIQDCIDQSQNWPDKDLLRKALESYNTILNKCKESWGTCMDHPTTKYKDASWLTFIDRRKNRAQKNEIDAQLLNLNEISTRLTSCFSHKAEGAIDKEIVKFCREGNYAEAQSKINKKLTPINEIKMNPNQHFEHLTLSEKIDKLEKINTNLTEINKKLSSLRPAIEFLRKS